MKILGRMAVFPSIPPSISRLHELAFNLWWTWTPAAGDLYRRIDEDLWDSLEHNPVRFLVQVREERLLACAADPTYLDHYRTVLAKFDAYMSQTDTWFARTCRGAVAQTDVQVAYFSMEFGLHECLPIYSGGLGILAGDHCKEASDLGIPFVGVGFLYPQGYFRQTITNNGVQEAQYEKVVFSQIPATPALTPTGDEVLISVDLPGRKVYAKVWQFQIGRIKLLLMDTDVAPNAMADRQLSASLYGGNHEVRVGQEIMLGIGGVRALRALGMHPSVYHMNEGHAAFLGLERIRERVIEGGLSFAEAQEVVVASTVFTTHTPVPAGNDVFDFGLVDAYFSSYWGQMGIDQNDFFNLGRQDTEWGQRFGMTALALRLSGYHNGVSALHGAVARDMWRQLWPGLGAEEVPIGHVTNGVHTSSWLSPEIAALYDEHLSVNWSDTISSPNTWAPISDVPDDLLWAAHNHRKHLLLQFVRSRVQSQRLRFGEGPAQVAAARNVLNPSALTIGFARRVPTYKRATLIFRDRERLRRLLNNPDRPVQILFAGKAHPADEPGKALIKEIYDASRHPDFEGKIIFLENYDMNMARYLVSGVDVWLNNPVRPYEASGTSGQKAALNGVPNCSIRDGWWDEGYDGTNGWAIGEARSYANREVQDEADSQSLYALLEHEIVSLYYERGNDGLPHGWIHVMKRAIQTCAPQYSMQRQVQDYTRLYYAPASHSYRQMLADNYAHAHELTQWRARIEAAWPQVWVQASGPREGRLEPLTPMAIEAEVYLHALKPEDVSVEVVYAWGDDGAVRHPTTVVMQPIGAKGNNMLYTATVVAHGHGSLVYGVRIVPHHPSLTGTRNLGMVVWA